VRPSTVLIQFDVVMTPFPSCFHNAFLNVCLQVPGAVNFAAIAYGLQR
jgi:hypothetical protein